MAEGTAGLRKRNEVREMLVAILSIMGVLSLVYFGIIVVYSGIETSMAWFWPALGILCFLLAEGLLSLIHI